MAVICKTCNFIQEVFEAAKKDAHYTYGPVIMLLKEMELQKRIELFASDCPIDEISHHLNEEIHFAVRHYFKCTSHERHCGERYFFIGACVRGTPTFKILDSLADENLANVLWGKTGVLFEQKSSYSPRFKFK
jgi:hypothetical protein